MKNMLLIIALLSLIACGGGGGSNTVEVKETKAPEATYVFGDSTSNSMLDKEYTAWPYLLADISGNTVDWDARPGITLKYYDVESAANKLTKRYKYTVLALGGNDVIQEIPLIDILYQYEETLEFLKSKGYEPVCHTYSYSITAAINDLNNGIKEICNRRGYKTILSGSETFDGVHPTNQASMITAENAWRLLY